jgi:hypothetical protein
MLSPTQTYYLTSASCVCYGEEGVSFVFSLLSS